MTQRFLLHDPLSYRRYSITIEEAITLLSQSSSWAGVVGDSYPSLTGNAGKTLVVKMDESGVEWATASGSGLTHPQVLARSLGS